MSHADLSNFLKYLIHCSVNHWFLCQHFEVKCCAVVHGLSWWMFHRYSEKTKSHKSHHHCHYVQCTYCCRYEHHQQVVLKSHHSFRSTKLCSHTIIAQNSVTFQLSKQELTVTFLTCLMALKNYSKHQASSFQWLNSLIKEQQSGNVCIFPEGWGAPAAHHFVQGCKLQTLDSLFPKIDFLV